MYIYIIKRKADGHIESANRTLEAAGLALYGYGEASFLDGTPFVMANIKGKMDGLASIEINYSDGTILLLEHHALAG